MNILQIVRDNLSNLARRGKDQRIKQDFRNHILTGFLTVHSFLDQI